MTEWTSAELLTLNQAVTIQNRPFNDDGLTLAEDNPVWEVL